MAARLQRTFTYSKYGKNIPFLPLVITLDHVGIAVRAFDDIYLYDSVYNGV